MTNSPIPQPRPKWVKAIVTFVSDEVVDSKYEYPEDGSDDELLEEVEAAVKAIFCNAYGHEIEYDQCGIYDHRYCVWCGLRATTIEEMLRGDSDG